MSQALRRSVRAAQVRSRHDWCRYCTRRGRPDGVCGVAGLSGSYNDVACMTPMRAVTLTLHSLCGDESAMQLQWSPTTTTALTSRADDDDKSNDHGMTAPGEYVTVWRSPYAVLRSRNEATGRCVTQLLPSAPAPTRAAAADGDDAFVASSSRSSSSSSVGCCCCCVALLYPDVVPSSSSGRGHQRSDTTPTAADARYAYTFLPDTTTTMATRRAGVDFVFALHLSDVTELLRCVVGADLYTRLVRLHLYERDVDDDTHSCNSDNNDGAVVGSSAAGDVNDIHLVSLCTDVSPLLSRHATWATRTLLTTEESNRIRWLHEETAGAQASWRGMQRCYARAPSLRALLVMSRIAAALRSTSTPSSANAAAAPGSAMAVRDDGGDAGEGSEAGRDTTSAAIRTAAAVATLPSVEDIRHVRARMRERGVPETLCDVAALVVLAHTSSSPLQQQQQQQQQQQRQQRQQQCSELTRDVLALLPTLMTRAFAVEQAAAAAVVRVDGLYDTHTRTNDDTNETHTPRPLHDGALDDAWHASTSHELAAIYAALLACRYAQQQRQQRDRACCGDTHHHHDGKSNKDGDEDAQHALPLPLLQLAEQLRPLQQRCSDADVAATTTTTTATTSSTTPRRVAASRVRRAVLRALLQRFGEEMHAIMSRCDVPMQHPQLRDATLWLLREQPTSAVCRRHFCRLVERSRHEASAVLQSSGLRDRALHSLPVLLHCLLPLLQMSRNEELCNTTLRDVLAALEARLQRGVDGFDAHDLRLLAELGMRAFVPHLRDAHAMAWHTRHDRCSGGDNDNRDSSYDSSGQRPSHRRDDQQAEFDVLATDTWQLCTRAYTLLREVAWRYVDACTRHPLVSSWLLQTHTWSGTRLQQPSQPQPQTAPSTTTARTLTSSSLRWQQTTQPQQTTTPQRVVDDGGGGRDVWSVHVSQALCDRYIAFVEQLVKATVAATTTTTIAAASSSLSSDKHAASSSRLLCCSALLTFVRHGVVVPNIQDAYRRKIYLLVNIADDDDDSNDGLVHADNSSSSSSTSSSSTSADTIPDELRLLVAALPYNFSSWASVAILREVLAASAGRNARYTFVLNAAMDLQLPVSTMRQRIATAQQLRSFLHTQQSKLTRDEYASMRQRCALNVPLAYLLSLGSVLLTTAFVCILWLLRALKIDFESSYVVGKLHTRFLPWMCSQHDDTDNNNDNNDDDARATTQLVSDYTARQLTPRAARRPTLVCVADDDDNDDSDAGVTAVCALARALPFAFYVHVDKMMSNEELLACIAHRIRRVSLSSSWLRGLLLRRFALDRAAHEQRLVVNTCKCAEARARRVTFLLYVPPHVTLLPMFVAQLRDSVLLTYADVVIVAHARSLAHHHRVHACESGVGDHVLYYRPHDDATATAVSDSAPQASVRDALVAARRRVGGVASSVQRHVSWRPHKVAQC